MSRVHLAATIDGTVVREEDIEMTSGAALPRKFHFDSPQRGGPLLAVRVTGFLGNSAGESPVLTRVASTRFVDGQTRLWGIVLDPRCLAGDPLHAFGGPVCVEPQTCIAGRCADSYTSSENLQSERDAGSPADLCSEGAPDVILGNGENGFAPLHDGDVLQMQTGPQGGHHIWLALRLRGFPARGTSVRISGAQPDGGTPVPAVALSFALDPDSGGYCRLTNLRVQLDADGADYHLFLGQPLDLHVDVSGDNGASGSGSAVVEIAPTLAGE